MNRFPSLVLALAAVAFPAAPAYAGIEDVLPAETLAYVGVEDVGALKKGLEDSTWGRFLQDPGFQSFRSWLTTELADFGAQAKEETGTDPLEMLKLLDGPAGVFLLDLADPDRSTGANGDVPVAFGAILGVGENGAAFMDRFDALWSSEVDAGNVLIGSEEIAGVEVTLVTDADENAENPMEMRYGLKGDTFVLTMITASLADRAYFDSICAGLDGLVEETLDHSDAFSNSIAGQGAPSALRGFANVGEIVRRAVAAAEASGEMGAEEKKYFDAFGFSELGSAAFLADVSKAGSRMDLELTWTGQGHLANLLRSVFSPGDLVTPKYVPSTHLSMNAFRLDVGAGLDAFLSILREVEPEQAAEAEAMMEMFFQQEGFHVRTDVIDNLANEVGVYQAKVEDEMEALPGTQADPMSVAILLPLKDGTKLEVALDTLLRQAGMHAARKRDEFQGVAVYSIPMPMLGSGIHYALTSDLLTLSLSRTMLEDVLRRHGGADLPSVADGEAYADALRLLGGKKPTSIGFKDAAESVKGAMEALQAVARGEIPGVMAGGAPGNRPGGLPFEVPDPDLAREYFEGTSVSVIRVNEGGVRLTSVGP